MAVTPNKDQKRLEREWRKAAKRAEKKAQREEKRKPAEAEKGQQPD
ncbi:MAG: hypothetical protein ACTSX7_05350 [Alphaproteobacteria bacterium]